MYRAPFSIVRVYLGPSWGARFIVAMAQVGCRTAAATGFRLEAFLPERCADLGCGLRWVLALYRSTIAAARSLTMVVSK
jgi:hypothetical protein